MERKSVFDELREVLEEVKDQIMEIIRGFKQDLSSLKEAFENLE